MPTMDTTGSGTAEPGKRPVVMASTEGKTREQMKAEVWQAFQKSFDAQRKKTQQEK